MRLKKKACVLAIKALLPTSALLAQSKVLSFFITSRGPGDGANVDGLAGADLHCTALAAVATNANRPVSYTHLTLPTSDLV